MFYFRHQIALQILRVLQHAMALRNKKQQIHREQTRLHKNPPASHLQIRSQKRLGEQNSLVQHRQQRVQRQSPIRNKHRRLLRRNKPNPQLVHRQHVPHRHGQNERHRERPVHLPQPDRAQRSQLHFRLGGRVALGQRHRLRELIRRQLHRAKPKANPILQHTQLQLVQQLRRFVDARRCEFIHSKLAIVVHGRVARRSKLLVPPEHIRERHVRL